MKNYANGIILMIFLLLGTSLFAQVNFRTAATNVIVEGTSTIHDWEMTSNAGAITATFELDAAGKPTDILSLSFTVGPTSLKSGKDAMDDNAYKALNTKSFNLIKFASVNGTVTPAGGANYTVKCTGIMQISGKSVNTEVVATCTLGADGSLTCNGTKAIKMTDFGVKPPTFMMGTIKTGDDLKIKFKALLKK